ncbi:DUF1127 domain-containing protein [Dongia deserti]|uniref:DUF1127 domain-containing protein n=1 Tax=Dongia deserti TaxID=2268030 RepID=UPI000E6522AC|nr:DUF1127 domain-containing protein [Dongia deserti]
MDRALRVRANSGAKNRLARVGPLLRRFYRWMTKPWRRRTAINELRRLNPRMLRDAGIERHEIDHVVDDMLA